MSGGRVYVVILNWNGWAHTIECLESVLRSDHERLQVVVCDNDSQDGSPERIRAWAAGEQPAHASPDPRVRELTTPALPKPIPVVEYDRRLAEAGGDDRAAEAPLVLVRTGGNLGYSGGNNVGLRYALARGDADFVWLLNNDTVVRPDALAHMVRRLRDTPGAGMCGSTLLYYAEPDTVQALGGFRYNRWLGVARQLAQFSRHAPRSAAGERAVERRMFGIQGASVLVTREFLERVGLLAEDYFLYCEELDWAVRARRAGLGKVYASRSVVYHKEGATTGGSSREARSKSRLSDYFLVRSRLLFTRRFFPYALPTVYLGLLGTIANRIRRRQFDRVGMVLRLSLRFLLHRGAVPPLRGEGVVGK